jgi:hypothetical protein
MNYYQKYLKYKTKYIKLKQTAGRWYANCTEPTKDAHGNVIDTGCRNILYWGSHELAKILETKYNYCVKTNPSFDRAYEVNACQLYVSDITYSNKLVRNDTHAHVYMDKSNWTLHVRIKHNGEHISDSIVTRWDPPKVGHTFQYDNDSLNIYADRIHELINEYFR